MPPRRPSIAPPPSPPEIEALWSLVRRIGRIDAATLLRTVATAAVAWGDGTAEDARTHLLMRDACRALVKHYLPAYVRQEIPTLDDILAYDDGDDRGFPTLEKCIVDATNPSVVRRMFEELGRSIRGRGRTTLVVGGSMPLILNELLVRKTDDADVVDEVPVAIREQYALLDEFVQKYRIRVSHFQSHFLPEGWRSRIDFYGSFDDLDVYLLDPVDVLANKLFTRRPKDWHDLSVVIDRVDMNAFKDRVRTACGKLREAATPEVLAEATRRWAILTGEDALPP